MSCWLACAIMLFHILQLRTACISLCTDTFPCYDKKVSRIFSWYPPFIFLSINLMNCHNMFQLFSFTKLRRPLSDVYCHGVLVSIKTFISPFWLYKEVSSVAKLLANITFYTQNKSWHVHEIYIELKTPFCQNTPTTPTTKHI